MLENQGRTDEVNALIGDATARTRAAIELEPGRWQGHTDYAHVLRIQGKLAEATAEYREALRLNPRIGKFGRGLVEVLTAQEKFDEAVAVCRQAVSLEPDRADAHYWLSMALRDSGQYDESLAEINRGRELALMNPIGRLASEERARRLVETTGKPTPTWAGFATSPSWPSSPRTSRKPAAPSGPRSTRYWRSSRAPSPRRVIRIHDGQISQPHTFCVAVTRSMALRGCVGWCRAARNRGEAHRLAVASLVGLMFSRIGRGALGGPHDPEDRRWLS
jgi:hypothetical protein